MPDEVKEAILDTVAKNAQIEGVGDDSPAVGADTEEGLYFGKYKTKEEAEHGYKEAEKKMHEATEREKSLQNQLEQAKQNAQIAESIKALADAQGKGNEPEALDLKDFAESLADKYSIDADAVEEMLAVSNTWIQDSERNAVKKSDFEALIAQNKQLQESVNILNGKFVMTSTDYQDNKEMIDIYTAKGMTLPDAIETAKTVRSKLGIAQPERINPPTSIGGSRVNGHQPTAKPVLSDKEKEEWIRDGFTPEDIAKYEVEQISQRTKAIKESENV